jgi:protein SCO1/2
MLLALASSARAATPDPLVTAPLPPALRDADVVEKLGSQVPSDLRFTDQEGRPVRSGELFGHVRPVVLTLVYFRCPMLCSLVMNGVVKGLHGSGWKLGRDYDAVTVSFDPHDTTKDAAEQRRAHLLALGVRDDGREWPFLVGSQEMIRPLADAVGFRFNYDPAIKQFAHTAAIFVLTPEGTVSRYLYGIQFEPKDLRLALAEAGRGKAGPTFDRVLLACYRYNPASRQYALFVTRFIRTGGLLVFFGLALLLGKYWRREWRMAHEART